MKVPVRLATILLALSAAACLGNPATLPVCGGWDSGGPLCELMNPEDLALLPAHPEGPAANRWVLVSEMTHEGLAATEDGGRFVPGRLTAIRGDAGGSPVRRVLFPREWSEYPPEAERWGEADCPGPPTARDFEPHGIDVGARRDGTPAVAVVTHGAREVIDLFELDFVLDSTADPDLPTSAVPREPALRWRGCVAMRPGRTANDVALASSGGFFVTDMMPDLASAGIGGLWTGMKLLFGGKTGRVLRWTAEDGLVDVPGSLGSAPNGLAISRDEHTLFIAEWGASRLSRLSLVAPSAGKSETVEIDGHPDNLTWTSAGQLLVAAQRASLLDVLDCGFVEKGGCDVEYTVTRVDPAALDTSLEAEGRGAASVALEVDADSIWVGVFSGDSIQRLAR